MTEQIVQNNYKIIADLKTYAKELRALTNIEDITEKMSHIRYYISTHRLLEEEFEKKYNNYEGTCFTSEGESYKDILDKVIKSELTKSFKEFNDSEYFYFPAFVETFDKFGMKKGLYAFYEFYGRANWSKILEKTGHAKEIKTLMENFCFYFVSLISIDVKLYEGLTDCHYRKYNFESFNLSYIYSIINGVLDYFQDLIYKNPDVDYSIKSNSTTDDAQKQEPDILPTENGKTENNQPKNKIETPLNEEELAFLCFRKNLTNNEYVDISIEMQKKFGIKTNEGGLKKLSAKIRDKIGGDNIDQALWIFEQNYYTL